MRNGYEFLDRNSLWTADKGLPNITIMQHYGTHSNLYLCSKIKHDVCLRMMICSLWMDAPYRVLWYVYTILGPVIHKSS